MLLQDLIPRNLTYLFRDLYESYWSGDYAGEALNALVASHAAIVAELVTKYGSYQQAGDIVYIVDIAGHALLRLTQMMEKSNSLNGNKDARVFLDALSDYFDELQIELSKLDASPVQS